MRIKHLPQNVLILLYCYFSGTKAKPQKLSVNQQGELVEVGGIRTRAQEIAALKLIQTNAGINHLQSLAEDIVNNGPGV